MDENTLKKCLKKDNQISNFYVVARDELPIKIKYPCSIILNNKPRSHSGEHWIAIYFDKNKRAIFFDSYGLPPEYYNLNNYIKLNSIATTFNNKRIQGDSNYCGLYCLLFLLMINRNQISKFFTFFSDNFYLNDKKIEYLLNVFKYRYILKNL